MQDSIGTFKKPLRTLNKKGKCWKYVREMQMLCTKEDYEIIKVSQNLVKGYNASATITMTKATLTFCCQTALTVLLSYEAFNTRELLDAM